MEQYSKRANNKQTGMTLLELELFVLTAKQAGHPPGACISGEITITGKQKLLTVTNDHSPKRLRIKT